MQISLVDQLFGYIYGNPIKCELQYRRVYNYLDKYVKKTVSMRCEEGVSAEVKENKTIWILWFQGMENVPKLVRCCYESVKRNKPEDFDLVVLTEQNLAEYIKLPDCIWMKYRAGIITKTHLSDIIRVALLSAYGGAWIDATVFCSEQIPMYLLSGDLFFFRESIFYPTVCKGSSWWIYAKKGNDIITDVREVLYSYWEKEDILRDYFLFHIVLAKVIDGNTQYRTLFNNMVYVNNSDAHILWNKMSYNFDVNVWNVLKKVSPVHKLSYKRKYIQGDIYNFYMALIEGKLI